MKVTCVLGSPRVKGNSAFLTEVIAEIAREKGAEVETFVLNKLNFKGCQACMSCKGKSEKCVVKDDMGQVLDSVLESDATGAGLAGLLRRYNQPGQGFCG